MRKWLFRGTLVEIYSCNMAQITQLFLCFSLCCITRLDCFIWRTRTGTLIIRLISKWASTSTPLDRIFANSLPKNRWLIHDSRRKMASFFHIFLCFCAVFFTKEKDCLSNFDSKEWIVWLDTVGACLLWNFIEEDWSIPTKIGWYVCPLPPTILGQCVGSTRQKGW